MAWSEQKQVTRAKTSGRAVREGFVHSLATSGHFRKLALENSPPKNSIKPKTLNLRVGTWTLWAGGVGGGPPALRPHRRDRCRARLRLGVDLSGLGDGGGGGGGGILSKFGVTFKKGSFDSRDSLSRVLEKDLWAAQALEDASSRKGSFGVRLSSGELRIQGLAGFLEG